MKRKDAKMGCDIINGMENPNEGELAIKETPKSYVSLFFVIILFIPIFLLNLFVSGRLLQILLTNHPVLDKICYFLLIFIPIGTLIYGIFMGEKRNNIVWFFLPLLIMAILLILVPFTAKAIPMVFR